MAAKGLESGRFVVLDGMRGLAALCVITDHVYSPFLVAVLPGRYLAVDFFFVLSGFVLSHAYEARLAAGMSPWAFMRARLIRLYPLYIAGLTLGAAFIALALVKGWMEGDWAAFTAALALNLLMLPAPFFPGDQVFPFNGPAWSLFFELVANFIFAVFCLRLGPRSLGALILTAGLVMVAASFHFGTVGGGWSDGNFWAGFPRVLFGFFAGVALYRLHLRWRTPGLPAWVAYLGLLALLAAPRIDQARAAVELLVTFSFVPLVLLCARSPGEGPLARSAAWLGAMSYGVYVLHVPIWAWLQLVLNRLDVALPGAVLVVLVAAAALLAAAAADLVYDRPLRRWLSRLERSRSPAS